MRLHDHGQRPSAPCQEASLGAERSRGTGLGLAIAHKVTELHQGRIRAYNRDDGETGCVVEITLPFLAEGDWGGDRAVTADITRMGSGIRKPPA